MAFEEPKWDSCIQSMLSFLKRFFLEGLRWRARQSYAFGRRDPKMAKNQEPIMQHDYIHFAFAEVLRRPAHFKQQKQHNPKDSTSSIVL